MDLAVAEKVVLWLSLPFGLAWGSFLNVCIYRLPLYRSVVRPRSYCPGCRRTIGALDNVPLLSYLVLGGRCRHCGIRISWRYPLVEAAAGLFTFLAVWRNGLTVSLLAEFLFLSSMLVLFYTDLDHQILPNRVTIPGAAAGLLLSAAPGGVHWLDALIGVSAGWLFIVGVARLYERLRGAEGMGMGDAKMMALIGAFLGWRPTLLTLLLASFLGSVAGAVLMARGRGGLQSRLPFGCFLAVAGVIAMYWGPDVIAWYGGLIR